MESLAQLFYDEANEMLEQMEQILLTMEERGADPEVVNALFRFAHSLKGNSGAMGFTHIAKFTHGLETAMEQLRKGSRTLTREMTDLLLQSVDVLRGLLDASRDNPDADNPAAAGIVQRLTALLKEDPAPTAAPSPTPAAAAAEPAKPAKKSKKSTKRAEPEPEPVACETPTPPAEPAARRFRVRYIPGAKLDPDNDPLRSLFELREYVKLLGCRMEHETPPLADFRPDACYATWELDVETAFEPAIVRATLELGGEGAKVEIEDLDTPQAPQVAAPTNGSAIPVAVQAALAEQNAAQEGATAASPRRNAESTTLRVATEKVDALFNLVSEIVIAQSMVSNSQTKIADDEVKMAVTQMERHVRELHERVMAIRMIPVGYVFNRFPRMVRDQAANLGKEVRLEISGEETELDRTLLESLVDPFTHLLRNSLDHGIEPPEERTKKGKPPFGTILLNAYQSEGRIYIEVTDDGRGIDPERVRQKAISLGWIREDEHPSNEQLYDYLFRPGFSTAEVISDVSGRGVGMDVVKRNVEALGGTVGISSEIGKGTRVTFKVPLTLAIMDGLNLRVGNDFFVVPLTLVIEAFRPENVTLCAAFDSLEMVNVRGRFLPLVKLYDIFGIPAECRKSTEGLLVILEQDQQQVAVLLDEIVGQSQIVMKSLETNFVRVPGFSGATILGDGRVALILDVGDLIRRAQNQAHASTNVPAMTVA